jgi:purine-binding chemotaxis protein CheW
MTMDTLAAATATAGKYLSFVLGDEIYGVDIMKVQEINGLTEATRVPRTADYVRGVINLRGKVIPVIDLRRKLAMETVADTEKTCNIVVQVPHGDDVVTMGVIVDDVAEVLSFTNEEIEPPPALGGGALTEFISGIGKLEDCVVILLDIEKVLSSAEIETLATVGA